MPGGCVRSAAVAHHTAVLVVGLAVFGLVFGSFMNVVIYRVPRGESVSHPPSRCPSCGHQLSAAENIPVVSWVALRGRCRHCAAPISRRYPLVEAATAGAFAASGAALGWSWPLVPFLLLTLALVAVVGIDVDGFDTPRPVAIALALAIVANAAIALAAGDDRALVRAVIAGLVTAALGAAGVSGNPNARSTSAEARRQSRAAVAGALGWFAGWASTVSAVVVAAVFALAALAAVPAVAAWTRRAAVGQGGGRDADAGRLRVTPLWLPVVLSYAAILGAAAAAR